ncbi:hypothetical protein LO763_15460 [Glycomyces sp. A-F 0318]|uniref:LppU/SCO3897 family protein n=1 Tax=Glycomyces amatae TaxID=2881355 RepID=UPI001E44AFE4|nr:hypothetical protein [Glycomyces amatae]MCD0445014.1 hypothetical protein [Glycomyces amatae]
MTDSSTDTKSSGGPGSRLFDKVGMAVVIEVLAGLVIGAFGLVAQFGGDDADPSSSGDPTPSYSAEPITDLNWTAETEPETEPEEEPTTDPVAFASVGDCFWNAGTTDDFELESSGCDPGAFEVVEVYGGDDPDDCDGVHRSSFGYAPGYDSVLCLSYLHPWGDAYYAESGECVGRGGDMYVIADCSAGNFQVLERRWGGEDSNGCSEWEYYNGSLDFPGYIDDQDMLLCMRMVYPDDIGYAEVDTCLYASGPDDDLTFEFADCSRSNAYVAGRTGEYDATGFCDGYGWATWQSAAFPEHSYTVCWAWL